MRDRLWTGSPWRRRAAALGLGAVAALGQAPFGLWAATLVALAFALWIAPRAPSGRAAAGFGWWLGTGYFLVALHWIVEPFLVDIGRHGWMAPFGLLFMAGGMALFWGAAGPAARRGPLAFALALALAEYLRSVILTGFPWALLGHIWIDTPVRHLAAFVGPHGLTAVTLVLAAIPAALPHRWPWRAGVGLTGAAVVLGGSSLWQTTMPAPGPDPEAPMVRIVQPNAPQDEKWQPGRAQFFFERALRLTSDDGPADLVVWPETSVPWSLGYAQDALDLVTEAAGGAPAVVGIQRIEGPRYYNSLVVLGPNAEVTELYDKSHLVPFGEYIPFGEVFGRFGIRGLASNEGGGYSAGPGGRTIQLPGIGAALPLICYEGIFAEEVGAVEPRPRLMLLITNDAWFGRFSGPYQHLAQARLRAVEQGLPMVRAANTGVSAMIDARGRVLESIPLGETGARDVALPPALPPTLYARTGDWWVVGALLAALALALSRRSSIAIDATRKSP
ncbi:apolipoprotein N-acyltransferase [Histidinibacterium aquaticum]|uniref:Apolipoprotein N-acyltransferase n=1 Tax=Histidinibacterium aquaticum TaxID=2613962 RepID=A0A5J5GJS2_9RHOB|nr:apolipoprotein N-acyltransferase [Histidinibacterium aquaticum]KAA9008307.1 apolipoprotein N-acyltransferase [Histidinibacterium aquaticum]